MLTGDTGELHRIDRPSEWFAWARVQWDHGEGPGMCRDGLACVAPRLLVDQ